eukprot:scaffold3356_cov112-Isochrysis_galbana.AAC.16
MQTANGKQTRSRHGGPMASLRHSLHADASGSPGTAVCTQVQVTVSLGAQRLTRSLGPFRLCGLWREGLPQKVIREGPHVCPLLVVGGAPVPPLDILPIENVGWPTTQVCGDLVEERLDHLARVARVHPVVLGGGGEEDPGTAAPLRARPVASCAQASLAPHPVVRGDGGEVAGPHSRLVGIAILLHPRGAREEFVVPGHVEQRHLAHNGTEETAAATGDHVAREQPAIGAADATEPVGRAHAAGDEVLGHRLKVLVRALPLLAQRSLVPAGPVLAASPDVGEHLDPSTGEPRRPDGA